MTLTTSRLQSALRLPLHLRLTPEQFGLVCAENRYSRSRGLTALRSKTAAYQADGARLGWLLIPQEQAVEATSEFPGLQLPLADIWLG